MLLAFALLFFANCNSPLVPEPDGGERKIEKEKLEKILFDMHIAEAIRATDAVNQYLKLTPGQNKNMLDSVLILNGVTATDFESTMSWYRYHNPKELEKILDRITVHFDSLYNASRAGTPVVAPINKIQPVDTIPLSQPTP